MIPNSILPPAVGKRTSVSFLLPDDLLRRVDALAAAGGNKRTSVLIYLLRYAIDKAEEERNPPRKAG